MGDPVVSLAGVAGSRLDGSAGTGAASVVDPPGTSLLTMRPAKAALCRTAPNDREIGNSRTRIALLIISAPPPVVPASFAVVTASRPQTGYPAPWGATQYTQLGAVRSSHGR